MARQVKDHFDSLGLQVQETETTASIRENIEYQFNVIVFFLAFMAVLIALVGCLGLMGTMSINVLERKREIGVMRAIGASDSAVLRIFVVEGVIIGILSWFGGILISQPMSRLISRQVGMAFLELPLHFQYNWLGPLYWLVIVLFISTMASLLPAWRAARLDPVKALNKT